MKFDEIQKQYGIHLKAIKRVGGFPLSKELQLSDLTANKKEITEMKTTIQRCYREMNDPKNEVPEELTVIDYLCWISSEYIWNIWKASKLEMVDFLKTEIIKEEINNLLRLSVRRPELLVKWGDTRKLVVMWHDNYMKSIKSNT